jgi:hypothetical protein
MWPSAMWCNVLEKKELYPFILTHNYYLGMGKGSNLHVPNVFGVLVGAP